ncbi:MAG: beta-Ala-His dipeptidase [Phycisphaerales bacterium]|nr:beta-Ala-His dipeptidase [Phycisphaerales bacterium]
MPLPESSAALRDLQPSSVWTIFGGMAAVPRPSKMEERIRAHLAEWLRKHELKYREDARGNMVIDVPATAGSEGATLTVLQAHVDMVCEKNSGVQHDFAHDPIRLVLDKDAQGEPIIRADGTTLGADNGIGVALALAAATDPDVVHGPLEILLTTDEEAGMTGADALTPESFRSRRLLNLDSEEDDALYIGCAGGCDSNLTWEYATSAANEAEHVRVSVSGLRGGHSGGDIHEGRGNANKLLVRTLRAATGHGLRVVEIRGGSKRNAIPREAHADVCGPKGLQGVLRQAADRVVAQTRAESGEADARIAVETTQPGAGAASAVDTVRLLNALAAIPSGVLGMHPKAAGLVETSNNLSTIDCAVAGKRGLKVTAGTLTRSSSESRLDEALQQLVAIASLSGAEIVHANRYPGWDPDPDSPLVDLCRRVYQEVFKQEPKVAAIHAGLECGIIGQRVGKMEMISFGPHITGAHSPDEQVWVNSVAKMWIYLKAVLAELART